MYQDEQQEISALKKELAHYQSIINEMTVPLLDSVIPDVLLMPLNGHLFNERIDAINDKLFTYLAKNRHITILVIDFTGISPLNIKYITGTDLSDAIKKSNSTMKLLGIRSIYTGMHPEVVFELVKSGFVEKLETYLTYKDAITKIAAEKNLFYSVKEIKR